MGDRAEASERLAQRGWMLFEQHRPEQAEDFFRQSIGANPENANAYYGLALTMSQDYRRLHKALEALEIAIAKDPVDGSAFALKALILSDMDRHRQAMLASKEAIRLAPFDVFTWRTHATLHRVHGNWKQMEEAAQRALEIDPNDLTSANLLSIAMRRQGRHLENEKHLRHLLARNPEEADTHANLGWARLQKDSQEAENHFLEALRIEPHNQDARLGLIESYKSRSWFYRQDLRFSEWMARFSWRGKIAFLGICLGMSLIMILLVYLVLPPQALTFPAIFLGLVLLAVFVVLIIGSGARVCGSILLLTNPRAWLALTLEEKYTVGAVILVSILIVCRILYEFIVG